MKKLTLLLAVCTMLAACNNQTKPAEQSMADAKPAMDSKQERNKKIIMASMDATAKGDVDGLLKDAAANFTDYNDGSMAPVTNIDSLKGFIKMLFHTIEGYKPENTMLVAEGDYVVAYANWSGIFKNDLMGIKATGKKVSFPDADIFKLNEEGKIIEHRSVQNIGAVLMASSGTK